MGHTHGSAGPESAAGRHRVRLALAVALIAAFFVVELVTAFVSGSLALLSDAGHMAADVVTLGAALTATVVAARPDRTGRRSFGNYRLEVFASLLAVLVMIGVAVYVVLETVARLLAPGDVAIASTPMLVVGVLGLLVNLAVMLVLREGSRESLNVKGAYLEVVADTAGSVGVVAAAILLALTGWSLFDTIVALGVGVFVAVRAVLLGREVLAVLSQSTPAGIDPAAVRADLAAVEGVVEVHDLHLWTLTSGMDVASAHLVMVPGADQHAVLDRAQDVLREGYGLEHATLQVEPADHADCHRITW